MPRRGRPMSRHILTCTEVPVPRYYPDTVLNLVCYWYHGMDPIEWISMHMENWDSGVRGTHINTYWVAPN
eukprot:SAG11_NODE_16400_length_548_cov_1.033408_2_plen_69_part_01